MSILGPQQHNGSELTQHRNRKKGGGSRAAGRRSWLEGLKRRGVIETGVTYLVLGWLLLQVADVTFENLYLPAWAPVFLTYLVIAGFPISLVLAWFIELTPRGPRLDIDGESADGERGFRKTYAAVSGALALAFIGVLGYDWFVGLPGEATDTAAPAVAGQIEVAPNSIAVLPFLSIGESEEGQIFSEGLTEDVLDRLARVPGLRVAARSDAFSLPPQSGTQVVRRRLRVAYYLEGSVRIVGENVRVVVQLIDSANGFNVLSRSFDRELKDFFAIQDEITGLTIANLRVALPQLGDVGVRQGAYADNTEDIDAYLLYRRGLDALYQPWTPVTMATAVSAFERALELDPGYAAAYAGICRINVSGYRAERDPEYIPSAEAACRRALELNANLDVVHGSLGELYNETGRYEDAESAFLRALDINSNAVSALIGLGTAYERQGREEDAEQAFRSAIGVEPGNWRAYNSLGRFYFSTGRFDEAGEQYREVVSRDVENELGWTNLGAVLSLSGRFEEALDAFERAVELEPNSGAYSNLAMTQYYLGNLSQAEEAAQTAVDILPNNYVGWSNLGDVLFNAGNEPRATEAFQTAERLAENELEVNNRDPQTLSDLAWIKTMLGKPDEAGRLLTAARNISDEDPYLHYIEALVLLHQGDSSAALDELESAAEMGFPTAMIAAEPYLASLHLDPRFSALVSASR